MKRKVAFIFPGQGSQCIGMGEDFYNEYSVAKEIYEKANLILNKKITDICFKGPEDILKQTINTQPAIVTTSIAILEVLKSLVDVVPDYLAGHSLGEYCALYEAGVLEFDDTIKAIQKRAELMSEVSKGTMAAVLNPNYENIDKILKEASKEGYVDVANYNSPVQIVLTGEEKAVKKASELFMEDGARKVVPLAVSGAFHSEFMKDASEKFVQFVSDLKINDAKIPVYTNVDAKETLLPEDFREKMPKQISSSVYWCQSIENMISKGVSVFVEIGCGKVLAGLNRKISSDIETYNIYDVDSLKEVVSKLKELGVCYDR